MKEKKPIVPLEKELKENISSDQPKLRYVIKKERFYDFKTDINKKI